MMNGDRQVAAVPQPKRRRRRPGPSARQMPSAIVSCRPPRGGRLARGPQHAQRREQHDTGCIAQPPREPHMPRAHGRERARDSQRGCADGGGDDGCKQSGYSRESEYVGSAFECVSAASEARGQHGRSHAFERVAGGDRDRRDDSCDALRLVRKAPMATAGQARRPRTSSAATAMPAGGHTADTFAFSGANERPSVPAMKYRTETTVSAPTNRSRSRTSAC